MSEERPEGFETWPAAVDPIREAVSVLLVAAPRRAAGKAAMTEALEAHERIRSAMADRRVIN